MGLKHTRKSKQKYQTFNPTLYLYNYNHWKIGQLNCSTSPLCSDGTLTSCTLPDMMDQCDFYQVMGIAVQCLYS